MEQQSTQLSNMDFDTAVANLYASKDTLLATRDQHFNSRDSYCSEKILTALEKAGIRTYGQLLAYAEGNYLSDLPGIGPRFAEVIHNFIEMAEMRNKWALEDKYYEVTTTLSNLQQIGAAQLKNKGADTSSSLR